jgi:hypothetical protein
MSSFKNLKAAQKRTFKAIKNHDLFGHLITFNFDNNGDTHKTIIGGFFSLIIKIMLSVYIYFRVKKLIFLEDANSSVSSMLLKVDLHGEVPLTDLHITNFYILSMQVKSWIYIDDPEVSRYLDFHFIE